MQKPEWRPPTWKSGEVIRLTSGEAPPRADFPVIAVPAVVLKRIEVTCAIVPRWVVMQPFERPVVPEV